LDAIIIELFNSIHSCEEETVLIVELSDKCLGDSEEVVLVDILEMEYWVGLIDLALDNVGRDVSFKKIRFLRVYDSTHFINYYLDISPSINV
jgi:hypothetical protein